MFKFKHARKYPMSLQEYAEKHRTKYGDIFVESRYKKAKFVYNCMRFPENTFNYPHLREWHDSNFGKLTKPEDAFEIWWDV